MKVIPETTKFDIFGFIINLKVTSGVGFGDHNLGGDLHVVL